MSEPFTDNSVTFPSTGRCRQCRGVLCRNTLMCEHRSDRYAAHTPAPLCVWPYNSPFSGRILYAARTPPPRAAGQVCWTHSHRGVRALKHTRHALCVAYAGGKFADGCLCAAAVLNTYLTEIRIFGFPCDVYMFGNPRIWFPNGVWLCLWLEMQRFGFPNGWSSICRACIVTKTHSPLSGRIL